MAYVKAQRRGQRTYYYLCESRREGKKVRQVTLKYLGTQRPSPEEIEGLIRETKGASQAKPQDEYPISPYIWYE